MSRRFSPLPEEFALRRVPWQLFATLTFGEIPFGHLKRKHMLHGWIRMLAESQRTYMPNVLSCIRLEEGGINGRLHYHAVIGGLGELKADCNDMAEAFWKIRGGGIACVRRFDQSRGGLAYMLKRPEPYLGSQVPDEFLIPTLSDSLRRLLVKNGR